MSLSKKLANFNVFGDLMKLRSHDLEDPEEIKKLQDRGVREIMTRAYKVPFYRKKFDEAGLKPSDFKEASDLHGS